MPLCKTLDKGDNFYVFQVGNTRILTHKDGLTFLYIKAVPGLEPTFRIYTTMCIPGDCHIEAYNLNHALSILFDECGINYHGKMLIPF